MKRLLVVSALFALLTPFSASATCQSGSAGNAVTSNGVAIVSSYTVLQNGNIWVTFGAAPGKTLTNGPTGQPVMPVSGCTWDNASGTCPQRLPQLSAIEQLWQLQAPVYMDWCANTAGGSDVINIGVAH